MKEKKSIVSGNAHVIVTFNNVYISVTDHQGNVQGWASSGSVGFKGNKKSTAYAAQSVATTLMTKLKRIGLKILNVYLSGSNPIREAALRAIRNSGIVIISLQDMTPVPHNGVRLRRRRRV
ncbi:30S ribosomal protein S11 [Neorickettsia risticii]|uniref:Small ribosomal subunit protein uS11 n=1 Tax=Neorickettsia risticii (strain Illinois) TaxID=434131 RepID=C6V4F1_NEORI|nr:30S ribosomal protein S11 [Neorickettsia risticii]ACT69266.1 ribosomal protein S11 [Neorickettsia risticii str. Illinois]